MLLAARLGTGCRGLVVVNGIPPPPPTPVSALLAAWPLRRLVRALYLRLAFSPAVLPKAYADPAQAPVQLVQVLAEPPRALVELLLAVVFRGARTASPPAAPTLLLWGESDRLPGTGLDAARKLERSLPGAKLVLIQSAGHCPQMERPAEFEAALSSFVAAASTAPSKAAS